MDQLYIFYVVKSFEPFSFVRLTLIYFMMYLLYSTVCTQTLYAQMNANDRRSIDCEFSNKHYHSNMHFPSISRMGHRQLPNFDFVVLYMI